ncbi:MAG: histidine kinase [Lachnospiraceae bacterium]|nr:histidine kinase [Lachnospiraceae bacterium]
MQEQSQNFKKNSIQTKLVLLMALILTAALSVNLFIFFQINAMVEKIDSVFSSNVTISELTDTLELVENRVYEYLNTKSSTALEDYYRYGEEYRGLIAQLNNQNVDSDTKMLEKNIRNMSETYLEKTEETLQAKRGRNVERYKAAFEEETLLYQYINSYIYELNCLQFQRNSDNYQMLLSSMRVLELFSIAIMVLIFALCLWMGVMVIRNMIRPLIRLAQAAHKVAEGDFEVELSAVAAQDEVGIVTNAFVQMVASIRKYIARVKDSLEKEAQMKERELSMEAHLKEAQLRYLQAQINPHFLFNSLNAGAQLAVMEDAEQTGIFMEKMADFFRYNVKKVAGDATLAEEIEAVDSYIYILNVRYAGDITYDKKIEADIENIRMPSMILQPIVENAVLHGIHDRMEEGRILLSVEPDEGQLRITVTDNGVGMSGQEIRAVMEGTIHQTREEGNSTGIGLDNVINRLKLYYNREDLLRIRSDGKGLGTEVTILLPCGEGGKNRVSDLNCG